jgi:DNA polymerase-3 subunit gamma/tau
MSKALYRKYRSKSLNEIIGQKHITDILTRAIKSGRISHAYLFTGPRGVGKTSVARILAHEINRLEYDEKNNHLDIIEIDAASNNGVEDVRDLREKVQIAPVSADKKIYIIDEVHMLSKQAFNALLKTLEEPPAHVVFILATTNIEKLPATIISRTQRFSFRPIMTQDAVSHLSNIAKQENIKIDKDALKLIAEHSDGSFRDSISLLDQLSNLVESGKSISINLIEDTIGLTPQNIINQILSAIDSKDIKTVVQLVESGVGGGADAILLSSQLATTVSQKIADNPQLLPLLDALTDVTKSPQPRLKLLSILGTAATHKASPKSAALIAPPREVSASIKELQKQATKTKPSMPTSKQSGINDSPVDINSQEESIQKQSTPIDKKIDISAFDWKNFIEHAKKNHVALHSVLSKCSYELDGTNLNLYTNSKFYKKKLDDVKYSPLISKCLQEIGVEGMSINTIPSALPPKDSAAAAVAAIMGGGEEVSIESI